MERRPYRYAALRHFWKGQWRNIGVVVHSPDLGFFQVMALGRGDLVKRLWDVPREEIDRIERGIRRMREFGAERAALHGLLSEWSAMDDHLRLGVVHTGTSQHLRWAVETHFLDYAHPEIQSIS